jgi:serine/threonine-protein kinase
LIGKTLSHFEITAKLGEGGMGEVYRAQDTSLGRQVAFKVLPEAFVADPERLARFEREAKVLASLNHQNIASIYEIGQVDSTHFLAMELAHGEDLATRLERGAIPVDEAVPMVLQVAEALEAAHDRGIVHRDLKPANVMLASDGAIKVLDFGLAKAWEEGEGSSPDLTASPTLTANMTQAGVILGTAAYMAPEQARGQEADRRADVWSFGVLMYEMLTGERLFRAETVSDTLARVLMADTDWERVEGRFPGSIVALLRRCLERDVSQRLQSIGEARIALQAYLSNPSAAEAEATPAAEAPSGGALRRLGLPLLVGAVLASAVWMVLPDASPRTRMGMSASLMAPPGVTFEHRYTSLALSPDGRWLVFSGLQDGQLRLFKRSMDRFESEAIPGTEGAMTPLFSPDGRWVFYAGPNEAFRVSMEGGAPHPLASIKSQVWGADWTADGSIIFNQLLSGLWRIPEQGGEPELLAAPNSDRGEIDLEFPDVLPDGSAVIYTAFRGLLPDSAEIRILDLATGERKTLIENASDARFLPTGHLIFGRSAGVYLVAFDPERREITGAPVPAPDGILYNRDLGVVHASMAASGDLVFLPRRGENQHRLVSVGLDGEVSELFEAPGNYMYPRYAPDGRSLLVVKYDQVGSHLWIANLATGALTRVTREGSNMFPVWHPDGQRVAFYSDRTEARGIYWMATDGSGAAELLLGLENSSGQIVPESFTPDGRTLVLTVDVRNDEGGSDSHIRSLDLASGEVSELIRDAHSASVSPDGQWIAYCDGRRSDSQVFVRSVSGEGGRQQLSTDGGNYPSWSPDGRTLYYQSSRQVMAVAIDTSEGLVPQAPRRLFEADPATSIWTTSSSYSVAPDGSGFLMVAPDSSANREDEARLILDWLDKIGGPGLD